MPTIQLTDNASLNLTGSTGNIGATLKKYLKDPLIFTAPKQELANAANVTVGQLDDHLFPLKASAQTDGKFAVETTKLDVKPGAAAELDLLREGRASDLLESLQLRDKNDGSPAPELLSFAVTGTLDSGPTLTTGEFTFGIVSGAAVTLKTYCEVGKDERFFSAAERTISGISIPHDLDDLKNLPGGTISGVKGTGKLQFKIDFKHNFLTNSLATEALSVIPVTIGVKAQVEGEIEATVTHTTSHELTIAALPGGKLHLTVSLTNTDDLETSIQVSTGITANIGNKDALQFLLSKISVNSEEEIEKLKKEMPEQEARGLSEQIKKVIDGAVDNSVKAALKEAFEEKEGTNVLFAYEVDLQNALGDASSSDALRAALTGDFTKVTEKSVTLPGITPLDSVHTLTSTHTHTLTAHLIGVLNFSDVGTFTRKAKSGINKDTGEIVLTSEDIEVTDNNVEPEKLRKVLVKSASITAAAAANTMTATDFRFKFVYFLRKANADRSDMQQFANILSLVNGGAGGAAQNLLAGGSDKFGDTALYLSLDLDVQTSRALFVDNGTPREESLYIRLARGVMAAILNGDKASEKRRSLFTSSMEFWGELKEAGAAGNVVQLLTENGIPEEAATDFFALNAWTEAMSDFAAKLAGGAALEKAAKAVVSDSKGGFDSPWALLATRLIPAHSPNVTSQFTCAALKPRDATARAPGILSGLRGLAFAKRD
ncbi:MAG: hypothetical protein JO033_07195 [Acidobacteriaceae bacterium]|nr:hypothetical protein [Acidobacteriaceae bacterium]MBV9498839.1 hypothetical protein [Acidobacteriaceae bacterium]